MFNQNVTLVVWNEEQLFWTWKTYFAVRSAYDAFLDWAIIISNMWLAIPHIRWYESKDLVPILHEIDKYHLTHITPFDSPDSFLISHDLTRSKIVPRKFYILCDEGAIFFDSRNFSKNFSDASMTAMMVTPRHLNMQITVVVQDADLLDKRFKDLSTEILEFSTTWLWFARTARSLKKRQFLDKNYHGEIEVLDKKTHWMYFKYKKDTSEFFGGLYYTKELLWPRAIRRPDDVTTLAKYFVTESSLQDWRVPYYKKLGLFIEEKIEQVIPLMNTPVFTTKEISK